jgi:membrane protein implicated in regulation of membrane protease activity
MRFKLTSMALGLASLAAGCDPVNDPEGFLAGVTASVVVFTILTVAGVILVTVVSVAVPLVVILAIVKRMQKKREEKERLLARGERATAQVIRVNETGTYVNNQPLVSVTLHVRPPGREPYEARVEQILSTVQIPRVQPGTEVAVSIDPSRPEQVALDLDAPVQVDRYCSYCRRSFPRQQDRCPYCGAPAD